MSLNKDTYNKIAKDWHVDHSKDTWWFEYLEAFTNLLKQGVTILDVGCAGGWKARFLVEKGFKVIGIDISEEFISIAKEEVPEGEFHTLPMEKAQELDRKFDAVFIQASLLHIEKKNVLGILSELISLLNPGGYIYVAVKRTKEGYPEESVIKEDDYGYEYERFFSFYTMPELESYFKDLNLEIVYTNTIEGETTWLQIIGKK